MHPGCKSIGHLMAKTHILPKYDSVSNIFTPSSAFKLLNIKEICLQCIKKNVTNIKYQDYVRFLTRLLFKLLYFSKNYKEKKCTNKIKPTVSVLLQEAHKGQIRGYTQGLQYDDQNKRLHKGHERKVHYSIVCRYTYN